MQIQLRTGVNIRLCFQIDIKYSQISFCPKSSSHQGGGLEGMALFTIRGGCHLENLRLRRWLRASGDE